MGISIHALLAESDQQRCRDWRTGFCYFNPRSPCGERLALDSQTLLFVAFQSTLSLRRATTAGQVLTKTADDFNPRSPCGERLVGNYIPMGQKGFQSTLSLRRATGYLPPPRWKQLISIHALLAESDPPTPEQLSAMLAFQSTLSLRRATGLLAADFDGDQYFNPRSPCGERQQIPPNWPYRFCLKCQFKDGEKSKKAKGSASAQASSPAYEKNKVRIPWGDFECFRFAPIK